MRKHLKDNGRGKIKEEINWRFEENDIILKLFHQGQVLMESNLKMIIETCWVPMVLLAQALVVLKSGNMRVVCNHRIGLKMTGG